MPKVIVTPEVLDEISRHVLLGEVKKLKIARYKTGAKAGQLYAEYSLKENPPVMFESSTARTSASSFLNRASYHLRQQQLRDIVMHKKDADKEEYTHRMELEGTE